MAGAVHAVDLIRRVAERLERGGAVRERQHLRGFSLDEIEVLVQLEAGWWE